MATVKRFERHRRLILVVVGLTMFLVLEVAAKWTSRAVQKRYHPNVEKQLRTRSPVYHHGLRPKVAVSGLEWGAETYPVFTSSLGFRDAAVRDVPLTNSLHRVLFIGDSFTEAPVAWEHSFVGLIARALAPRGVEVLNAGVASYSPAIHYAKCRHVFETVGLRVQELVVFVDVSDAYDDAFSYELDAAGRVVGKESRWPEVIKENTIVLAECVRRWQRWSAKEPSDRSGPKAVRNYGSAWTWDDRVYEAYGREGEKRMVDHMDALLGLARQHGVRLNLAFYPWPAQLYHTDKPCRSRRLWQDWSKNRGVPALDLYPVFQKLPWAAAVKEYYIEGDVHWNRAGNALVAQTFLEAVARQEILSLPRSTPRP